MSLRVGQCFVVAAAVALAPGLATTSFASPIVLSNLTSVVTVYGGEAENGLVPAGGYFSFTDVANSEETTWSIDPVVIGPGPSPSVYVLSNSLAGGFGSPVDMGGGVVRSTATIAGVMDIFADTTLVGTTARTDFTFTPIGDTNPEGYRFLFYAENDLFTFADDTAAYTGSIGGGDLKLYEYDSGLGGLTVVMSSGPTLGATLSAFGSGVWTGWGTALEGGDVSSLSADGSSFVVGPADLGLALLYDLNFASPATLTVNYGTQADPPDTTPTDGTPVPEPGTMMLLGVGLAGLAVARSRRRTA